MDKTFESHSLQTSMRFISPMSDSDIIQCCYTYCHPMQICMQWYIGLNCITYGIVVTLKFESHFCHQIKNANHAWNCEAWFQMFLQSSATKVNVMGWRPWKMQEYLYNCTGPTIQAFISHYFICISLTGKDSYSAAHVPQLPPKGNSTN